MERWLGAGGGGGGGQQSRGYSRAARAGGGGRQQRNGRAAAAGEARRIRGRGLSHSGSGGGVAHGRKGGVREAARGGERERNSGARRGDHGERTTQRREGVALTGVVRRGRRGAESFGEGEAGRRRRRVSMGRRREHGSRVGAPRPPRVRGGGRRAGVARGSEGLAPGEGAPGLLAETAGRWPHDDLYGRGGHSLCPRPSP